LQNVLLEVRKLRCGNTTNIRRRRLTTKRTGINTFHPKQTWLNSKICT